MLTVLLLTVLLRTGASLAQGREHRASFLSCQLLGLGACGIVHRMPLPRNLNVSQILFFRGWREESYVTDAEKRNKYKYNDVKRQIREVSQDLKMLVRKMRRLTVRRRHLKLKLKPLAKLHGKMVTNLRNRVKTLHLARLEEERETLHVEG